MTIWTDQLDAAAADFTAETPALTPSADPYGRDVSCVEDIDPTVREVEGEEALAEAWARRLSTPRGSLGSDTNPEWADDPDYGLDCQSFLHRKMTAAEIASIPGQIESELLKDERTREVKARLVRFDAEQAFECELDGYTAEGPFRFTFAATTSTVGLLVRGED